MTEEPRDPFRDEPAYGPWHNSLRDGEMLFLALAEQSDAVAAITAVKRMSKDDLEAIVLERLYCWHAARMGPVSPEFRRWLYSEREEDSQWRSSGNPATAPRKNGADAATTRGKIHGRRSRKPAPPCPAH